MTTFGRMKFVRLFYGSCLLSGIFFLYYLSAYRRTDEEWQFKDIYNSLYGVFSKDGAMTCNIPRLDPWDPSIKKYLTTFKPLKCKSLQYELTYLDDNGWLVINETARKEGGYTSLTCKYRCFSKNEGVDDSNVLTTKWNDLKTNRTKIDCEFVEVSCHGSLSAISVYSNLHSQIIPLKPLENVTNTKQRPSVLLFVLDSISKSNFYRYLPKFLNTLLTEYDSVVLDGFTKVGDNSFPNGAAVLSGKRTGVSGYPNDDGIPDDISTKFVDDWPLIWYQFKNSGYITYYAEDYPNFNVFHYVSKGFRRKPTDHYFRPFWVHMWGSFLHRRSTHLCYGNKAKHSLQLQYLKQFLMKYSSNTPKFAFNWLNELGHDWLGQIVLGDEDFDKFFRDMKERLNNTILIVFSDHGHRFDAIRESVIGRIEERMPFCSVSLPKWMKEKYPTVYSNLKMNSQRLTSHFDLHATLIDVVRNDFENVQIQLKLPARGLSLFRPIPLSRQCLDAGIPDEYCVCQEERQINVNDSKVFLAANTLIDHVNNVILKNFSKSCVHLELDNVKNAQIILPNVKTVFDEKTSRLYRSDSTLKEISTNYRIIVQVSPSGALLESLLKYSFVDDNYRRHKSYKSLWKSIVVYSSERSEKILLLLNKFLKHCYS